MIQLIEPDLTAKGTIGNCLRYARNVFKQPAKYPTAWSNWDASKTKHRDRNYPQLSVPLWFSYFQNGKNMGHVVVYVPGKGFYSSPWQKGTTHAVLSSIAEIERIYHCNYVGWTEDIEGTKVVGGDAMVTKTGLNVIYRFLLGQSPTDFARKNLLNKVSFDDAYNSVLQSDAYKVRSKSLKKAKQDLNNNLPSGIR